ncbi:MAG: histidinol dehydrogenase [Chloroflexota bacterium]|nr:histidinol dehydrogenase [Chloroflexota bacterium]
MRVVRSIEEAKGILQRSPFGTGEIPASMRERIRDVFGEELTPEEAVGRIIADVRQQGDAALLDYTRRIDGVALDSLCVSSAEIEEACHGVDDGLLAALRLAAEQIRSFHQAQMRHCYTEFSEAGLGQTVRPLDRVGVYVPGGTACYPSTVLMTAIPARVAGVREIALATPPRQGGEIPPATLAAAHIAGVDAVFRVGGAQAIAALALGTESVARVDKVCGPGGLFIVLAKKMLFGIVGIDGLEGPTETIVLADETADPSLVAADLLAQAEHDPLASALLITTSAELAGETSREVERQLGSLERADIARESLDRNGCIIVVEGMEQAIELANLYAPEHLSLMVRDPSYCVPRIRHAGGVFIGESSPETLGDYVAGPSHVMPTGGTARFRAPLCVADFLRIMSVVSLDDAALRRLGKAAATIARAEGFTAHARAVEMRLAKGGHDGSS